MTLDTTNLPWGVAHSLKKSEEHDYKGYILECIDVFDAQRGDDDLGIYYAYCKDVDAVTHFLAEYGYYIGTKLSQVKDCCTDVIEIQRLLREGFNSKSRINIREWLERNKIDYKLDVEGCFVL